MKIKKEGFPHFWKEIVIREQRTEESAPVGGGGGFLLSLGIGARGMRRRWDEITAGPDRDGEFYSWLGFAAVSLIRIYRPGLPAFCSPKSNFKQFLFMYIKVFCT